METANAWPMVPLSEVLTRSEERVEIRPDRGYLQVTVRLWGGGVVLRNEVSGARIAAKKRYVVRPQQFLLSRIDARNGAFGLVPESLDGAVVSNDFPTFNINRKLLEPRFLEWMSKTKRFVDLCQAASEGTTNRVRLQVERFLVTEIPLPPLEEQRRIVARIEELTAKVEAARVLRQQAIEETQALLYSVSDKLFNQQGETRVGDFAKIQSGYAFKSDWFTPYGIRLVRNINIGHGKVNWGDVARIPESMRADFDRFELSEGDILISLDRPIISTGLKVALVSVEDIPSLLLQRVGRVCFQSDSVLPEFFFAWLQSPKFIFAIDPGRSNGVPHISQRDIERISFAPPPLEEQRRIVAYLDTLQTKVEAVKQHQAATAVALDALLPSILDRAFRGEL